MSYATDPIAPGGAGRPRPGAVTISSYLLYLITALQVLGTITAFVVFSDYQRVVEDAYADVEGGEAIASITSITLIGGTIFGLLIGIGLAVLAIFNNKGKNASRITTWVVGGIFLCCGGLNLIGQAASGSMNFGSQPDPNAPTPEELNKLISDALPSWYMPVGILLSVVGLIALLTALILLALPPSNEFFRKPQAQWQPPTGAEPGYLAYPAYPAPGAPPVPPTTQPPAAPPSSPPPPPAAPPSPPAAPDDPTRP